MQLDIKDDEDQKSFRHLFYTQKFFIEQILSAKIKAKKFAKEKA